MKRYLVNVVLAIACTMPAAAVGVEPFVGEIRWVAFNFPPRGWAFCDGQQLNILDHESLYSLLGTTYGGDGRTTFRLPDLRGRVHIHAGEGPGLTARTWGTAGGAETATLDETTMPTHTHRAMASAGTGNRSIPNDRVLAVPKKHRHHGNSKKKPVKLYAGEADTPMDETAISPAGGGAPHENMPPYLTLRCIIALQGIFPSTN